MAKELTRKEKQITELYFETTLNVGKNADNWISFLKRASFNYKYRFDEQILIYAQRPDAVACAETTIWNKKLKRWINKGSKGIALITEKEGELGLRFVFDVSDTNSDVYGRKFKLWQAEEKYTNDIIEALEDKFGTMEDKSSLPLAIISTVYNRVVDNMQDYLEELKSEISGLPAKLETILEEETTLKDIAEKIYTEHDMYFLGRGTDYHVAMEGSLKVKEISYIHSEAYASGELKHGTIALIEDQTPVIGIITQDRTAGLTRSNLEETQARGANAITIVSRHLAKEDDTFVLPDVDEVLTPLLSVIPAQLLAYYTSLGKGLDVDKPRNLAKSVTVQ